MKMIRYELNHSGIGRHAVVANQSRMTPEMFRDIFGGGPVDVPPNWQLPPDGYGLWRTARGDYFATRSDT